MFIYILLLTVSAYLYWHFVNKRRGLPPGPTPWPIFGNLLEIFKDPPGEKVYSKWRDQYGDVYTYWLGSMPVVAVTGYKTLVDTFQKDGDSYSGRIDFRDFDTMVRGGPNGVVFIDGELWRDQRRFALQVLRDFGLGKNLMQERILDEVHTIFDNVEKDILDGEKEHALVDHVDLAVGSIINALLFGYRFHGEKRAEFFDLKQRVLTHFKALGHPLVFMAMANPNFYIKFPVFDKHLKAAAKTGQFLIQYFRERINEHKKDFVEEEEPKDYVHAFLKEWHRRSNNNEDDHFFSENQLVSTMYDLWLAGQETTSNTLSWGFAFIVRNPEAQRRCQEELDRVIGSDRMISMSDKPNLHYCNATINEIQRMANLLPQNVSHRTTKQVEIQGHVIPKNTAVMPQISVVLNDEEFYPNPERFDPERFLDAEGKLKRSDELVPFGIGKRACLGESLARMELFLFFANIINRYKLTPGLKLPSMERKFGATVAIDHFTCRMERRL